MGNNGNDLMAYQLFRFLKEGVSVEQLQAATDKAFGKVQEEHIGFKRLSKEVAKGAEKQGKSKEAAEEEGAAVAAKQGRKKYGKEKFQKMAAAGKKAKNEGIVVADPSTIDDPEGQIQTLAEEKKEQEAATDPNIKTNGAGITEEPERSRIQKEMEKLTPDPDKLTQGKDGLDPDAKAGAPKAKEEKKIEPKVTSVEKVKESEVPTIKAPEQGKEKKTEEVSGMKKEKAENEKDRVSASEGIVVADPSTIDDPEGQIQTLAEERVLTTVSDENVAKDIQSKYPGSRTVRDEVNGKPQWIIMVKETKTQEGVDVAITTDDKKIDVTSTPEGTTVTTSETPSIEPEALVAKEEQAEHEAEETPEVEEKEQETGLGDEDTLMAEKIYVSQLLKGKSSLTEKEQKFIKEVEGFKLTEARKAKIEEKIKALKNKSTKK